jgi:predicted methyltransferase
MPGPLLTLPVHDALLEAARLGTTSIECSLDLGRTRTVVNIAATHWTAKDQRYPYLEDCRDRTVYHWTGTLFEPVARYGTALVKLVPTPWGPPTFEIDGIKMLPTARVSPFDDARQKVALIEPAGKQVLDTCGGLGYFAAWCLESGAAHVLSFEKSPDVLWLRALNPWSPESSPRLRLEQDDVHERIVTVPDRSIDAVLHDPPRFGIAGELYSAVFYRQLARVLRRRGRLFHYTGTPNRLTTGRDVPREVARRLQDNGFAQVRIVGDGVLASRT